MGMGLLWQTDHITMKGKQNMKKQTIIPPPGATDVPSENKLRTRAAVLAALSITAIILGVIAFAPQEQENAIVELQPVATPEIVKIELAGATNTPIAPTVPPTPAPTEEATPAPTTTPSNQEGDALFTLDILENKVFVAYGVEETTLKQSPGWLTTSALPGEDGMCVVYGHRNRNHLKALEKVENGDIITISMPDGASYRYTVCDITIYESTDDLRLPTTDGKTLVLVTCYPFRYSGHAPGKYLVLCRISVGYPHISFVLTADTGNRTRNTVPVSLLSQDTLPL